jgi:hypothetical protein
MAEPITLTLILVGPYAGKSITLNNRIFRGGECVLSGQPEQIWGAVNYLRNYYNAHIKGSKEHAEAEEAYKLALAEGQAGTADVENEAEDEDTSNQITKLKELLGQLDHSVDEQWTKGGRPSLAFLEETLKFKVSKDMIESVAPGIKRSI